VIGAGYATKPRASCAKPHFVHHEMMRRDHGEHYAAVSCYNA